MKKYFFILIILIFTINIYGQTNKKFLPKYETEEEKELRKKGFKGDDGLFTPPPNGFVRSPAEFAQMEGLFITWGGYQDEHLGIVNALVSNNLTAFILVDSSSQQSSAEQTLNNNGIYSGYQFVIADNNSVWTRDYGPFFIYRDYNNREITNFDYDRYRPDDNLVPYSIGQSWGINVYSTNNTLYEGGNFVSDGMGRCFATQRIYDQNDASGSNHYTELEIQDIMRNYCGCEELIVLESMIGDGTRHIDMFFKLLDVDTVMISSVDPGDTNYNILENNANIMANMTASNGNLYEVVRIPMGNNYRTYTNSVFCSNVIIIPQWGISLDSQALSIYQSALPNHQVVGVNCADMAGSGGSIHCITVQVPVIPPTNIQVNFTNYYYDSNSNSIKLNYNITPNEYLPIKVELKKTEEDIVPSLNIVGLFIILTIFGIIISKKKNSMVLTIIIIFVTASVTYAFFEEFINLDPAGNYFEDNHVIQGKTYKYQITVDGNYSSQEISININ